MTAPTPPLFPENMPGFSASVNVRVQQGLCAKCSYNLHGLPIDGTCPKCGTRVAASLQKHMLQFRSKEYLAKIHLGLVLILTGIVLTLLLGIAGVVYGAMNAAQGPGQAAPPSPEFVWASVICGLFSSGISLTGYFLYTELDIGQAAQEQPNSARSILRLTVLLQVALAIMSIAALLFSIGSSAAPSTTVSASDIVITVISLALWLAQFFAMMIYTSHIGRSVPDAYILKRAKTYMWLLPLIAVPGILLLGLGPLIALVMYYNLLDRLRKQIKSIRTHGTPAVLEGSFG